MLLWSDITSGNKFSLHKTSIMFRTVMCTKMKTVHFLLTLLLQYRIAVTACLVIITCLNIDFGSAGLYSRPKNKSSFLNFIYVWQDVAMCLKVCHVLEIVCCRKAIVELSLSQECRKYQLYLKALTLISEYQEETAIYPTAFTNTTSGLCKIT